MFTNNKRSHLSTIINQQTKHKDLKNLIVCDEKEVIYASKDIIKSINENSGFNNRIVMKGHSNFRDIAIKEGCAFSYDKNWGAVSLSTTSFLDKEVQVIAINNHFECDEDQKTNILVNTFNNAVESLSLAREYTPEAYFLNIA